MSENENETKTEAAETKTGTEHEFDVMKWRASMLTATAGVCRELDANEIDEDDYGRIFKAVRLIMDPEYDDRPPIVRGFDHLAQGLMQNPQLLPEILKLFGVVDAFKLQPVEPAQAAHGLSTAYVFLKVTSDGEVTGAAIASEEYPTTADGMLYLRLLTTGGSTFEEARRLAYETYELAYPELAKKFPVS